MNEEIYDDLRDKLNAFTDMARFYDMKILI